MGTTGANAPYDVLLDTGRALYPGLRFGRPGRARSYWLVVAALRVLRLRWRVCVEGADQVGPGGAILVANHVSALDPLVVVMSVWWRVTAFTKVEWFQSGTAPFFRLMGQIPLRRGDAAATDWAIRMAGQALADGGMIGLYPEGTRSPDPTKLHRLHGRVLLPVLEANPDVPVHAITTSYSRQRRGRIEVAVRLSPPLDVRGKSPQVVLDTVRDTLLELGGQTYVDASAWEAKRPSP